MDFLVFISAGPLWVRLVVAVLVLPFTLFLDLITLLRSLNENCCGLSCCSCCCVFIPLLFWVYMTLGVLVTTVEPDGGRLLVNPEGVLLAPNPSLGFRLATAGMGRQAVDTLQASAVLIGNALSLAAWSLSVFAGVFEAFAKWS